MLSGCSWKCSRALRRSSWWYSQCSDLETRVSTLAWGFPRSFASEANSKCDQAPSVSQSEVEKFQRMAKRWWDPAGPLQPLHAMNPTRCKFIRDFSCSHFGLEKMGSNSLEGLKVLDIGCGGGILSEAAGRMGADILGIDVVSDNITMAEAHLEADPLLQTRIRYELTSAEDLAAKGELFDLVFASEVIEHVRDPRAFCKVVGSLTKPSGAAVISTLNRTPQAYLLAILGAEDLLRLVPKGTHDWKQFITPEELAMIAGEAGLKMRQIAGMSYNPWSHKWRMGIGVSVNYIAAFAKVGEVLIVNPVGAHS